MKLLLQALKWLLTGAMFLLLFAFSLNNQSPVQVNFIFGFSHSVPLIMVVLAALGIGIALGVMGMMPYWIRWRRRIAEKSVSQQDSKAAGEKAASAPAYRESSNGPATEYGP